MEERVEPWAKGTPYGGKYDIDEIHEDREGLECCLTNVDTEFGIVLSYDTLVFVYKNVYEGVWLDELHGMIEAYGKPFVTQNTFFEVHESALAKEVEDGSYGAVCAAKLFHLKIVGANAILDIVSFGEPEIIPAARS